MTALHDLDATEQAALLRAGEVTSVELVTHHLERAERLGPDLGAFVTLTADRALDDAADADRRLAAGDAAPLLGVPTAVKDLTSTAGVRTTMGSVLMAENVPHVDAHVVTLMRRAGLVSLGKTNTPEFGLSSFTDNALVGPARTPWDRTRTAGGSSGGAAAAVGARIVPLAQGSDGGGSIRIPASCCGVVGLKPSRGRVSAAPLGSEWSGLATDGPLTRTVRDVAALLDVLAEPAPGDLRPAPRTAPTFTEHAGRDPERLRIARWTATHLPDVEPSADAVAAADRATALLTSLGHEVVEVPNPFPAEMEPQFNLVWSSGMAAAPIPDEALDALQPTTRYWLLRGREVSGAQLAGAMQALERMAREALLALEDVDVWLTPTLSMVPPPVGWFTETGDPVEVHRRELRFTPYTALYNMAGVPAVSLPVHVAGPTTERPALPVGAMLASRHGQDGLLLSLAAQVEVAADGWPAPPA